MTTLRARLDVAALRSNTIALRDGGDGVADLRRDAWGHGLARVAPILADVGLVRARVDARDLDVASATGLTATDDPVTVDPDRLFGLPGSPVLEATSSVLTVKRLLAGEGVSYGHAHRAAVDTRVALIAGGYGQGVVRALGNGIRVEIGGVMHPVVGRIAMDVCVVDIGEHAVRAGDRVVLFGGDGPARSALETWRRVSGLSAGELVCAIGLHARMEAAA